MKAVRTTKTERPPKPGPIEIKEIDGTLRAMQEITTTSGPEYTSRIISEATVRVTHTVVDAAGLRQWKVTVTKNKSDEPSVHSTLTPDTLEKMDKLHAWASGAAGLAWEFSNEERVAFKRFILAQEGASQIVHDVHYGGVVEQYGVILGLECSIGANSEMVENAENRTVRLQCRDGKNRTFGLSDRPGVHFPRIPKPDEDMGLYQARITLADLVGKFASNLGDHRGAMALGWTFACLFYAPTMRIFSQFPQCYLYGRTQSGKNHLARYLMDIAGMGHVHGMSANSKWKAVRNSLSETAGFPLWVNEFRANMEQRELLTMVRALYDGQGSSVAGMKGGTISYEPRRGLLMTGEDLIGDDAERSRYVCLACKKKGRRDYVWEQILGMKGDAAQAYMTVVSHRERLTKPFIESIKAFEAILGKRGDRQAFCWAVALAGLRIAITDESRPPEEAFKPAFVKAIKGMLSRYEEQRIEQNELNQFWQAAASKYTLGRVSNYKATWARRYKKRGEDSEYLGIWIYHLCEVICKESRLGSHTAHSYNEYIVSHLKEENYYAGKKERVQMGDVKATIHILRMDDAAIKNPTFPAWIANIAGVETEDITVKDEVVDVAPEEPELEDPPPQEEPEEEEYVRTDDSSGDTGQFGF